MEKSMVKGIVIGGIASVALAAGGITTYKAMNTPRFAEVVAVKELTETIKTPREECHEVQVQHQAPVKDEHRIAGTVVGGIIGGALGSTIGGGTGKTVATVAGAAAGGYAGNKVQKNMQEKDVVTETKKNVRRSMTPHKNTSAMTSPTLWMANRSMFASAMTPETKSRSKMGNSF